VRLPDPMGHDSPARYYCRFEAEGCDRLQSTSQQDLEGGRLHRKRAARRELPPPIERLGQQKTETTRSDKMK